VRRKKYQQCGVFEQTRLKLITDAFVSVALADSRRIADSIESHAVYSERLHGSVVSLRG
jgi:hypothetical protein